MSDILLTRASSINRALDQIGDKWCLIIIQELFWGINTFNELHRAGGISKGVLAKRLKWLEQIDCLEKIYPKDSPRHPKYKLTKKSEELYNAALMAIAWEKRFFQHNKKKHLTLVHKNCGKAFTPEMRCSHCYREVLAKEVSYRPGPGAKQDERAKKVRRRSSVSVMEVKSETNTYLNLIHIIGDRWTANVLALAYHGIKRFDGFHAELPIATNILSDRLKFLNEEGLFVLVPYQERPLRNEYYLSEKGLAMYPFFLALLQWGDKWCGDGSGAPLIPEHKACGHDLTANVYCDQCNQPLYAKDVRFQW